MYKDKDRQKEANRERQRRYKEKQKALPKALPDEGVTCKALPLAVVQVIDRMSRDKTTGKTDEADKAKRTAAAKRYQELFPDRHCCWTDQSFTKLMTQADIKAAPLRVSKPGDADYTGVCHRHSQQAVQQPAGQPN
jgi:hypothetical protein